MDFQLSDDQELIRTAVRKICADYPDEYWAEKDEKHTNSRGIFTM